jgi:hypothetical protein
MSKTFSPVRNTISRIRNVNSQARTGSMGSSGNPREQTVRAPTRLPAVRLGTSESAQVVWRPTEQLGRVLLATTAQFAGGVMNGAPLAEILQVIERYDADQNAPRSTIASNDSLTVYRRSQGCGRTYPVHGSTPYNAEDSCAEEKGGSVAGNAKCTFRQKNKTLSVFPPLVAHL